MPKVKMMERYTRAIVDDEPELPNGYCHIRSAVDAVLTWCEMREQSQNEGND